MEVSAFERLVDLPPAPPIKPAPLAITPSGEPLTIAAEEEEWTEGSTSSADGAILLRSSTSDDIAPTD
jgi:hypothetical protein